MLFHHLIIINTCACAEAVPPGDTQVEACLGVLCKETRQRYSEMQARAMLILLSRRQSTDSKSLLTGVVLIACSDEMAFDYTINCH